jgi:hypothetical protein
MTNETGNRDEETARHLGARGRLVAGEAAGLGEPLSRYRRPPLARSIWSGTISFGHIDGNIPHQNR